MSMVAEPRTGDSWTRMPRNSGAGPNNYKRPVWGSQGAAEAFLELAGTSGPSSSPVPPLPVVVGQTALSTDRRAPGWPPPSRPVSLPRLELEDGNRHVRQVMLPDDNEVAAPDVMAVAQEVRRPVLCLG